MKMQKKRIVQCGLSLICAFGIALSGMSVHAEEVDSLEDKTSNLQSQLEGINQDLVTISNEIAETEVKIEESIMKYSVWKHRSRFPVITRKYSMQT